ncbi:hypothetical protein [Archangium sp.]|uniref:hypothetical protein n=1 Tax=Archangium sp. TaxID=1872627 RepID=UPI002D34EDCC|nr:hypothetical protein [Archangium sp.]HYO51172.1 hypothetical protein [Archangium sp.]
MDTASPPLHEIAQTARKRRGPHTWLLAGLDGVLSEHLRRSPATELARARIMVGAACFLVMPSLPYLIWGMVTSRPTPLLGPTSIATLGYVSSLVLVRGARSIQAPAMLLCMSLATALVWTRFILKDPQVGNHGFIVLYLRRSFPDLVYPSQGTPSFQVFAMMGAWVLSALHSTARDEAQKSLSESQASLLSLIESTDDRVCSLDLEGRLRFANSAMRHELRRRFGQEPVPAFGQHELWRQHLAKVASGQRLRFEEESVVGQRRATHEVSINPIKEVAAISESVEHIKSIVSMQQKHARAVGALEQLPVPQLIDETLRLQAVSLERRGITVERDYEEVADPHEPVEQRRQPGRCNRPVVVCRIRREPPGVRWRTSRAALS